MRATSRLRGASLALLGISALGAGCAEDIAVHETPAAQAQAIFDPSLKLLPTPTDLAKNPLTGLLAVPVADETKKPAQAEFDRYLNTLDGFPTSATVTACFSAEPDPATVAEAFTAVLLPAAAGEVPAPVTDMVIGAPVQTLACPLVTTVACDPKAEIPCAEGQVCVPRDAARTAGWCATAGWQIAFKPKTSWQRGRQYAFFLTNKLKTTDGKAVGRSASFELAAGDKPICEWNETEQRCVHVYSTLIKSLVKAGAGDITEDQLHAAILASGTDFERLRRATDALVGVGTAVAGFARTDVILTWAFSTVGLTEAVFDPTAGVIPGPGNDMLYSLATGKVNIPERPGETATDKALRMGLNTLDGFSTTGTYFTLFTGKLDASRLASDDIFLAELSDPPVKVPAVFEFNESAMALTVRPKNPLKEKTRYIVALLSKRNATPTTAEEARASMGGLADAQGQRVVSSPVFALAKLQNPLVDGDGKSQISVLDDASAAALEPLRALYGLLAFPLLKKINVEREDVAVLWTFQTQSITDALVKLRAMPYKLFGIPSFDGGTTANPLFDNNKPAFSGGGLDSTRALWPATYAGLKDSAGALGKANLMSFSGLDPATDAMLVDPSQGRPVSFPALIMMPTFPEASGPCAANNGGCAANTTCATEVSPVPPHAPTLKAYCVPDKVPVVLYQHGIGQIKETFFAVGAQLAKAGYAVVAFDVVWHGDRTLCTAAEDCETGASCIKNAALFGHDLDKYKTCCSDATPTACGESYFKKDSYGRPVKNSDFFLNVANPFAIRDNMRQHVVDAAAVLRTLSNPDAFAGIAASTLVTGSGAAVTPKIDTTQIHVVGQSLGSILNVLVLATDSTPKRGSLIVPGAPLTEIFRLTEEPDFVAIVDGLLDARGLCSGEGAAKVCPRDSAGALQLFHTLQWILDPADPANFAQYVKKAQLADDWQNTAQQTTDAKIPAKQVMVQIAGDDKLIKPELQEQLCSWMDVDYTKTKYEGMGHNFALVPTTTAAQAAYTQMITFLTSANADVCTPDINAGTCTVQ